MKIFKSLLVLVALVFAAQTDALSQTTSTEQAVSSIKTSSIKVKGVGCSADIKSISNNVKALKGVSNCEIEKKGAVSTFVVTFDTALVSEEDIYTAIESTGGCKNPNDRPYKVKL
ncbi:MAG: hypothetical protein KJP00_07250 [Bacteroidia bacterium]|nr:hypothetical protein [Bacteroidia bacterium]